MTKLQKIALSTPYDPGEPPYCTLRFRTETVKERHYDLVPVFTRDLVDVDIVTGHTPRTGDTYERYTTYLQGYKKVPNGYDDKIVTSEYVSCIGGHPPRPQVPLPDEWDATAWSIDSFPAPVRVTWKVSGAGATFVGLSFIEPEAGSLVDSHIVHGILVEDGMAYARSMPMAGMAIAPGSTDTLLPYANASSGTTLAMEVVDGRVSFFVGGVLIAVHPSAVGVFPLHLSAILYSTESAVTDATIEALPDTGVGSASLRIVAQGGPRDDGALKLSVVALGRQETGGLSLRLYAKGTDTSPGYGSAKLPALSAFGDIKAGTKIEGAAHLFRGFASSGGDYDYFGGSVSLQPIFYIRTEEPDPDVNAFLTGDMQILESTAPYPHGGMQANIVGAGTFDASISPGVVLLGAGKLEADFKGSVRYLAAFATMGVLGADWKAGILQDVAFVTSGTGSASLAGLILVTADFPANGVLTTDMLGGRTADAAFPTIGVLNDGLDAQQVLNAALEALGMLSLTTATPGQDLSVWSVNAATGGSTAYDQYPFNSYATINGRNYGAAEDGIYELVGDTDDGGDINSYVNLGQRDFGTPKLKSLPHSYLGVSSTGRMIVRVTAEGKSYTYQARAASYQMQTQRVDFGRGLRANYFTLELMNEGGADFDLDIIELAATELTRRI